MASKKLVPASLFESISQASKQSQIIDYVFDPLVFNHYLNKYDPRTQRAMRVAVLNGTIQACRTGQYEVLIKKNNDSTIETKQVVLNKQELLDASLNTKFYGNQYKFLAQKHAKFNTHVSVQCGDCIEAALALQKSHPHLKIAVLNMASNQRPGGSYLDGSAAQEENLHRRTNLYMCLDDIDKVNKQFSIKSHYPLEDFAGIYSPNVTVFRSSEAKGYKFLTEPRKLDFIAMAAYRMPPTIKTNKGGIRLTDEVAVQTRKKIERIFQIALENNVTALVLSALGCGAYKNPPLHIAEIFKEVVEEYKGCFEFVVFAIFEDVNSLKNSAEGNLAPFATVFNFKPQQVQFDD